MLQTLSLAANPGVAQRKPYCLYSSFLRPPAVMTSPSSPPPLLFLGSEEVERLLPMGECIALMERALRDLALGAAVQPLRSVMRLDGRPGLLGFMPGQAQVPVDGSIAGIK